MSTVADTWPAPLPTGRPFVRRYPWDEWSDGQWHVCRQGEDFQTSPRRFACTAWMFAQRHALDIETAVRGTVVHLRFVDPMRRGC